MIKHYLKVAVRNLLKYKTQSLISILGLAVGFACMSLSVYWNHYETTYDAFQKNADRIYRVRQTSSFGGVSTITPGPLAEYLMNTHPEVEAACLIRHFSLHNPTVNGIPLPQKIHSHAVSPEALNMFDFEWINGEKDMNRWGENKIAIAEHVAKAISGNQSPIGMKVKTQNNQEFEIVGVFKDWPEHSNFKFDIIAQAEENKAWNTSMYYTYAMLLPGVNHQSFLEKMKTDTIVSDRWKNVFDVWIPLKEMRYTHPEAALNVHLKDVRLFTMAAVLIIVCALLNYLTLFISRLQAKGRNLALRTVYGSSAWQTGCLLMTEYMLLLFGAWFAGMLFVELSMSAFMELALISVTRFNIYQACGYLILFIIALSAILSSIPILYAKKKTLAAQITPTSHHSKSYFRSVSVCVQLVFSLLFIFCSVVMMKQIHYLTHSDIHIQRNQIGWLSTRIERNRAVDLLNQLPCITQAISIEDPLFPPGWGMTGNTAKEWEGKPHDAKDIFFQIFQLNDSIARFYGLKMKEGPASFTLGKNEIFINETFAKQLNMEQPIGKTINGKLRIKGIIHDYQSQMPTEKVQPFGFFPIENRRQYIGIRYNSDYDHLMKAITEAFKNEAFPNFDYKDGEQTYEGYLKSENNLLKLLGITTVVSMLIALFGIYALIVQSCEQHRKEIAIRKVHGVQVSDILLRFFRQYILHVVIASAVAFPIGFALMKRWLEGYSRQTDINVWIFASIFLCVSALVVLSIGYRVWKAANENPADVVRSE